MFYHFDRSVHFLV